MKKLRNIIILVIVIIFILLAIILYDKLESKKVDIERDIAGDPGEEINFEENGLKDVTDKVKFYTVSNCVQQYLDNLNINNDRYYGINDDGEYTIVVEENEIKQNIYDLLSSEYINENKITINNIYNYVNKTEDKIIFIPLKMKVLQDTVTEKYIVYGIEEDLDNNFIKYLYIIVNMDNVNGTFSIEPLNEQYKNIDEIEIDNQNMEIEENNNNIFSTEKISYEYVAKKYMEAYKKIALSSPKDAYELLDSEYKNERFGSLENYENYIQKNREDIMAIQHTKFLVNNYSEYTQYVCVDQYNNYYIFNEIFPMNFGLKLDTYTILTEKFKTTYDSSDEQNRIMMNVDRWVKMLNNRDYTAAYNFLDQNFRNNNFGSEEKFEEYMRQKFSLHYKVEFGKTSKEGNVYLQEITLSDITEEDQSQISNTIIMQLKDNYEFVMSFSVE